MESAICTYAAMCAALHCCTTPAYAAGALNFTLYDAADALRNAAADGLFRRVLLPGFARTACYQPTPKSADINSRNAAKFLRAGAAAAVLWRGLLRGGAFAAVPCCDWLSADAQAALRALHGIPSAGHAEPLVGIERASEKYCIYVPVPPALAAQSANVIANAAARWLPLLEQGTARLNFIAATGRTADALNAALVEFVPHASDYAALELAELDARIEADKTGLARLQLARPRAELAAVLASAAEPAPYPWLAHQVVSVSL
ncbi:hypothetical protein [Aquitalea sp.]|uniref:hypothetical protein n=1 Tax=Aquitalea sp. TaxID=1872623 RepID=UPI0025850F6F|nr:hypothetical protein [Aquitalea sp.]